MQIDYAAAAGIGYSDEPDRNGCRFYKSKLIDAVRRSSKTRSFCGYASDVGNRIQWSGSCGAEVPLMNKAVVICNKEESDGDAVELVENIYKRLECILLYMDAEAHDLHAAYVSHISHITSFALANTVLEKEKEEDAIFELASGVLKVRCGWQKVIRPCGCLFLCRTEKMCWMC